MAASSSYVARATRSCADPITGGRAAAELSGTFVEIDVAKPMNVARVETGPAISPITVPPTSKDLRRAARQRRFSRQMLRMRRVPVSQGHVHIRPMTHGSSQATSTAMVNAAMT
ncbi:hypothetical protein [Bradyrhizobium brasilense]|uniref:Uncharacterized protein n=1 Tax=Bradyrhizobium brasilense TaxID=1419277 RepID=A0ABY8J9Z3_9BRAD|nr:hypothetical protein [Bradyrhizobium brasilense]WFU61436.1 hypothetical protein QA636_28565 [Bradyrhizobium brasilense]